MAEIDEKESLQLDFRNVLNPYVIIIGISEYSKPNSSLSAVKQDIARMKALWSNMFSYQHVSCITDSIGRFYITLEEIKSFLNDSCSLIQLNKKVDGLILVYSGHGGTEGSDNVIVSSDNKTLSA
eukprot:144738_1